MKKLIIALSFSSLQAASFSSWKGDQVYKKGELEEARALYEEAVMKHPDDMGALYKVGKTAYTMKDYSAAVQAFEKVAHSEKSTKSLKEYASFNLGDSYLSQHQYEPALKAYQEVLALNPDNEHAKKRIDLVKKLMEEQKKNEQEEKNKKQDQKQENNKEKDDKNKKGNQKSDSQDGGKDKQNSQGEQNDSSKQEQKDERKNEDKESESQKGAQEPNKEDKGKQNQRKQDGTDRDQGEDAEQNDGSDGEDDSEVDDTKQPKEQKRTQNNGQDGQHQGPPEKKSEERSEKKPGSELSKDQKDDTSDTTAHAGEKSIAEEQLNDQEKRLLEQVEKGDRQAQRIIIRRAMPTKPEHDGTKNW